MNRIIEIISNRLFYLLVEDGEGKIKKNKEGMNFIAKDLAFLINDENSSEYPETAQGGSLHKTKE